MSKQITLTIENDDLFGALVDEADRLDYSDLESFLLRLLRESFDKLKADNDARHELHANRSAVGMKTK